MGARPLTMDELQATLADLERLTAQRMDLITVLESRLFDQHIRKKMVPTHMPSRARPRARRSAGGLIPLPGNRPCIPALIFRPIPALPSSPRRVGLSWRRNSIRLWRHGQGRPRQPIGNALSARLSDLCEARRLGAPGGAEDRGSGHHRALDRRPPALRSSGARGLSGPAELSACGKCCGR